MRLLFHNFVQEPTLSVIAQSTVITTAATLTTAQRYEVFACPIVVVLVKQDRVFRRSIPILHQIEIVEEDKEPNARRKNLAIHARFRQLWYANYSLETLLHGLIRTYLATQLFGSDRCRTCSTDFSVQFVSSSSYRCIVFTDSML